MTDEESGDLNGVDAPVFESAVTIAEAPRLTKATWRQSGRRKLYRRINNWGGVTVAPAAFLEAAKRTQFKPGRPAIASAAPPKTTDCHARASPCTE